MKKKSIRKWGLRLGGFLLVVLVLFLLRHPILRGMGNYLAKTDSPTKVDAAFVLSGASEERTKRALEMYPEFAPLLFTTGEIVSQDLTALGLSYTGAEVMRDALLAEGADSLDVGIIKKGTSTYEESEEILGFALARGFKRVMIVSSIHHTRRIHGVFTHKFREAGIEVVIIGAEPLTFSPRTWWHYEDGLIMVTNEYLKLLYYWWRY